MKKIILSTAFAASVLAAGAQDLIVKRDSTRVEARVEEISPEQIRYRRFAAPAGPVYVLPVAQVAYIRYSDGYCDRFDASAETGEKAAKKVVPAAVITPAAPVAPAGEVKPAASSEPAASTAMVALVPATPVTPAADPEPAASAEPAASTAMVALVPATPVTPAAEPEPAPAQQQERNAAQPNYFRPYKVGDLYDDGSLKGVIVDVTENGRHGLIISLDEAPGMLAWTADKAKVGAIGLDDMKDGRNNMARLAEHIAAKGERWSDYPAFEWCRSLGDGWYLPSIDEVLRMAVAFNGGSTMVYNRKARVEFNRLLGENGGKKLDRMAYYFSSTEMDDSQASSLDMNVTPAKIEPLPKHTKWRVRAVHRF